MSCKIVLQLFEMCQSRLISNRFVCQYKLLSLTGENNDCVQCNDTYQSFKLVVDLKHWSFKSIQATQFNRCIFIRWTTYSQMVYIENNNFRSISYSQYKLLSLTGGGHNGDLSIFVCWIPFMFGFYDQ